MSVEAGFMLPHPPIIIPAIGKDERSIISETIAAYEKVAEEIAVIKPETIIISSPHATMYSDYFHISPKKTAFGSFSQFNAGQIRFEESYDYQLVEKICAFADKEGFRAGTLGERDPFLDHGTMVPLWFIRQKYKEGKIVRISLSGLPLAEHYRLGMLVNKACLEMGRKAVYIASGDLSHKLQEYGPYGFVKEGPEYDERIMDVCSRAAFGELFDFDEDFLEKAAECGHRSFLILAGVFDGVAVKAKRLSHQDVTGVGYGICTFYPDGEDENRHFLQAYEDKILKIVKEKEEKADDYVKLAQQAVAYAVRKHKVMKQPEEINAKLIEKKAGVFVSIHKFGKLRGCIGTIFPTKENVAQEIIANALSASLRDPRFDPIQEEELKYLQISVDVLGQIEDVASEEELDEKRYGVIVSCGERKGLLLPDLEGVDTVKKQISIALSKGNIREYEDYKLQRFEVVRHE